MTRRRIAICVGTLLVLLGIAAVWINSRINGSLPKLDGSIVLTGLSAKVDIARDAMGVPTIDASSRADAAYALGFVHAQDRFFQMDLLRRQPAGRLAELFGYMAIPVDQEFRLHRFTELAEQVIANSNARHLELVDAYTKGVNAGLNSLKAPPVEYLLLRAKPEPWRKLDCVLVTAAMFCNLQDQVGDREFSQGQLKEVLPPAAYEFLNRPGSTWDTPLIGPSFPDPEIPDAADWSLRTAPVDGGDSETEDSETASEEPEQGPEPRLEPALTPGSNNWAVGAKLTTDGRAIMANDMHLGHSVPNIWYRAVVDFPASDDADQAVRLVGVTLPGTPALVVGSNGSIAWGLTNVAGDFGDLIELKLTPDGESYLTVDGPQEIETVSHNIQVKGQDSVTYETRHTRWGPIVNKASDQSPLFAHRWVGRDAAALNFDYFDIESQTTVDTGLKQANLSGIVHANIVIADSMGNVGWSIAGKIPRRPNLPPQVPVDWSNGELAWQGYYPPEEYPRVVNPESGFVFTANQRVVGTEGLKLLGDGGYTLGARARQIKERLLSKPVFNEQDLLNIQLDDEARYLKPWQQLLLETMEQDDSVSRKLHDEIKQWGGHAAVDSAGYRIVRDFHDRVQASIWIGMEEYFQTDSLANVFPFEGVAWQLLESKPEHLLQDQYASWDEFLAGEARSTLEEFERLTPAHRTWGYRNELRIQHPLSKAIPKLSRWLDMPARQLPGDAYMPRVQRSSFGASQRIVVAPGHEEDGIFHMPGGQSGHPRSPFYRAGFDDWAEGRPTPLMPGPAVHQLQLIPKS